MKVLLTGGGSGGHVSPALAVAKKLQNQPDKYELLYIGGRMTMEGSTGPSIEETLVTAAGIPYTSVSSGKLRRGGLSIKTLTRLWGFIPGIWQSWIKIRRFNPDVVFSSGGYVSLPVVLAAAVQRKPIVIHEQTAAIGLTNSISARFATKIAVTFPQSIQFFPKDKAVVTGNPIRNEVLEPKLDETELKKWIQTIDRPLLFVTGGGLGSHIINTTIEALLPELLDTYCVIHQCGSHAGFKDFERLQLAKNNFDQSVADRYWPSKQFTPNEMGYIYHHANLVVGRAGANTVLELAAVGVPALFIPIPWVTHDEQTKNAEILVEAGLADIIPESTLTPQLLSTKVHAMLNQKGSLEEARQKARQIVAFDATDRLVQLLAEVNKLR